MSPPPALSAVIMCILFPRGASVRPRYPYPVGKEEQDRFDMSSNVCDILSIMQYVRIVQ
jgi:hypothetical protein